MFARPGLPAFEYVRATSPDEVVGWLQEGEGVRLMMGGTDLLPRMRDGLARPRVLVDVKHVEGMQAIDFDRERGLTVGAAVPLNALARHPAVLTHYPLLAEAAESVASYQVRNRATLGGNLCNASPAADTAPAALVLGAIGLLCGSAGRREVPLSEFFQGPGRTALAPDEFLLGIRFPASGAGAQGRYAKLGRSRAGDLAIAGVAVCRMPDPASLSGVRFRVALASVAPTPLRAMEAEALLEAEVPGEATWARAAAQAAAAARPIDDVRASADYRREMVRILALRALRSVCSPAAGLPSPQPSQPRPYPVVVCSRVPGASPVVRGPSPIAVTVNGSLERLEVPPHLTLLQLLRDRLGLTGTKNGCEAGECGACTVLVDGEPMNACMVLAVEVDGCEVLTVEGLAEGERLHALQEAMVEHNAVQCGFCTPGVLMSAYALLRRNPHPSETEIRHALVGNLCRCTGYVRIVRAVQAAAQKGAV